jgi:hypothetical protein
MGRNIMARTAAEYQAPKALNVPETLPEGTERATIQRYLERAKKDDKGNTLVGTYEKNGKTLKYPVDRKVTFKQFLPAEGPKAGAAIVNFQNVLNENGIDANNFVVRCIRAAMIPAAFDEYKLADDKGKDLPEGDFVVEIASVRVTDEAEAAGNAVTEWMRQNPGQIPTPEQMAEIFGSVAK